MRNLLSNTYYIPWFTRATCQVKTHSALPFSTTHFVPGPQIENRQGSGMVSKVDYTKQFNYHTEPTQHYVIIRVIPNARPTR